MQGRHDFLFNENTFDRTVRIVKSIYGLKGDGDSVMERSGVNWKRYTGGAARFEAALYDYKSTTLVPGTELTLGGHCFPSKDAKGYPKSLHTCDGAKDSYTWGKEALAFFRANRCEKKTPRCPDEFPYPSHGVSTSGRPWKGRICYNKKAYADRGSGPCHSWCTNDLSMDDGCNGCCGDYSKKACKNYE